MGKEVVYEPVLGMVSIRSEYHFRLELQRNVLRTVMKLFDPEGFVTQFIVHGKILMQEIWLSGTNWDVPLAERIQGLWNR